MLPSSLSSPARAPPAPPRPLALLQGLCTSETPQNRRLRTNRPRRLRGGRRRIQPGLLICQCWTTMTTTTMTKVVGKEGGRIPNTGHRVYSVTALHCDLNMKYVNLMSFSDHGSAIKLTERSKRTRQFSCRAYSPPPPPLSLPFSSLWSSSSSLSSSSSS